MSERLKNSVLLDQQGQEVNGSVLKGKIVMLYFSAHWCPPCRQFTPILKQFYEDRVGKNGDPFEIVFMSSDHSEEEAIKYFRNSHGDYYMLDYNDDARAELGKDLNVRGIPALILIDKDGKPKVGANEMRQLIMDYYAKKDISDKLAEFRKLAGDWSASKGTKLGSNATSGGTAELSKDDIRQKRLAALQARSAPSSATKAPTPASSKVVAPKNAVDNSSRKFKHDGEMSLSEDELKLVDMGYTIEKVKSAMATADSDFDTAMALLMSEDE